MKIFGLRKGYLLALLSLPFVFCIVTMLSSPIRVQFVYGILPVLIGSNSDILPKGTTAIQRGMFIFVEPSLLNNDIIINHEIIHAKQYYRTISVSYWWALISERHLADVEAEAYVTEANSPKDFNRLADLIKEEYAPSIDKEYITNRLQKYWEMNHG